MSRWNKKTIAIKESLEKKICESTKGATKDSLLKDVVKLIECCAKDYDNMERKLVVSNKRMGDRINKE